MKKGKLIISSMISISILLSLSSSTIFANGAEKTQLIENKIVETNTLKLSEEDLKLYSTLYDSFNENENKVYGDVEYNPQEFYGALRAIDNETYNDYFKSVSWITRSGVTSLSIIPTSKLLRSGAGNSNGNVLMARAFRSFDLLKAKHSSSSKWKNTASLSAQYHCHVMWAGGMKTPWNIEPHRTESNLAIVTAKACNP